MRKLFTTIALFLATFTASSQVILDNATIEEIVKNEKSYYNDILNLYLNDDPFLRVDDIALVYYGQAFMPQYNPGGDENEKALKKFFEEDNYAEAYKTAKKILEYNPVSLNALFNLIKTSKALNKSEEEYNSYVKKYLGIIDMIAQYGDGKSSKSAFRIITPDDQDYVLFGKLGVGKVITQEFDRETLCNMVIVEPTQEFQSRRVYFDLTLFLTHVSE